MADEKTSGAPSTTCAPPTTAREEEDTTAATNPASTTTCAPRPTARREEEDSSASATEGVGASAPLTIDLPPLKSVLDELLTVEAVEAEMQQRALQQVENGKSIERGRDADRVCVICGDLGHGLGYERCPKVRAEQTRFAREQRWPPVTPSRRQSRQLPPPGKAPPPVSGVVAATR